MSVTEAGFKVPTFGHETVRVNGGINKSMKNGKKKKKSIEKYFYSFFSLFLILNFSNLFINIRNWIRNQSIPIFGHETARVNGGINKSMKNEKKKKKKVLESISISDSKFFKFI